MDQNLLTPREPRRQRPARRALTLIELVVVLFIMVALAAIVVPMLVDTQDYAAEQTTKATLVAVRDAMIRQRLDTKYLTYLGPPDTEATEANRFHIRWLFENPDTSTVFDPDTQIGWSGPYLTSSTGEYVVDPANEFTTDYGTDGDPAALDGYERKPVVCQVVGTTSPYDVRIVSAGPNGELNLDPATTNAALEADPSLAGDDEYVAFILR